MDLGCNWAKISNETLRNGGQGVWKVICVCMFPGVLLCVSHAEVSSQMGHLRS